MEASIEWRSVYDDLKFLKQLEFSLEVLHLVFVQKRTSSCVKKCVFYKISCVSTRERIQSIILPFL